MLLLQRDTLFFSLLDFFVVVGLKPKYVFVKDKMNPLNNQDKTILLLAASKSFNGSKYDSFMLPIVGNCVKRVFIQRSKIYASKFFTIGVNESLDLDSLFLIFKKCFKNPSYPTKRGM